MLERIERDTARVSTDALGQPYLVGSETVTHQYANIFANNRWQPVSRAANKKIAVEAEVRRCFSAVADDDPMDASEIFQFRLVAWCIEDGQPLAEAMMSWEDFNADDPPGAEYGWDGLLIEAVSRVRRAWDNRCR